MYGRIANRRLFKRTLFCIFCLIILICLHQIAYGLIGSKHDLSTSKTIVPCIYCHTPHNSNKNNNNNPLLWDKNNSGIYQLYSNEIKDVTVEDYITSVSLVCFSCHDGAGTISNIEYYIVNKERRGPVNSKKIDGNTLCCFVFDNVSDFDTALAFLFDSEKSSSQGDHIFTIHPVSTRYIYDKNYVIPPDPEKGWEDVPLFNGMVECSSCHNPHDTKNPYFLNKPPDMLCSTCHKR